jgi:hypothetical protein
VRHHIYSFSPAHKFDQKLYSGVAAAPQVFDKAGTVVLGCNIHDKMLAYVKVVDTPYFAKTDGAGAAASTICRRRQIRAQGLALQHGRRRHAGTGATVKAPTR